MFLAQSTGQSSPTQSVSPNETVQELANLKYDITNQDTYFAKNQTGTVQSSNAAIAQNTTEIAPSSPSFTVWTANGKYYAKNSYGNQPAWSGSNNASYVINSCIDLLNPDLGGEILLTPGRYLIDQSILISKSRVALEGESGAILSWIGSVGGSAVVIDGLGKTVYDASIEKLEIDCNDGATALYLRTATRFTLRDIVVAGGSVANSYDGVVLDAAYGNVAWGTIDNVHFDYVNTAIEFVGHNDSAVVTDISIGTVIATNVHSYGLRFAQWTDTIDVNYAYVETIANDAAGAIFNDAANLNVENGVYNIHISRLVYDNWQYSVTHCVYLNNNVKEIVIDSAWNNDDRGDFGFFANNVYSYYIVQQGQSIADNGMQIFQKNSGFSSGRTVVNSGSWIMHYVGKNPTTITVSPEAPVAVWVTNKNATYFQVEACWLNGTKANNITVDWVAVYKP